MVGNIDFNFNGHMIARLKTALFKRLRVGNLKASRALLGAAIADHTCAKHALGQALSYEGIIELRKHSGAVTWVIGLRDALIYWSRIWGEVEGRAHGLLH